MQKAFSPIDLFLNKRAFSSQIRAFGLCESRGVFVPPTPPRCSGRSKRPPKPDFMLENVHFLNGGVRLEIYLVLFMPSYLN